MPERLRRLEYIFEREPIYFVTACTEKRREILSNPAIHRAFIQYATAGPTAGAWIGDYVLMPDHLHLFVRIDADRLTLPSWGKALRGSLSLELRRTGLHPPFWQKGFFDHLLRSSDSYSAKWEYVRENPVRAELVSRAEDWPYVGQIFDIEFRRDRI